MSRPIRIEFSGAFFHASARGDRRENIYDDDTDRDKFLAILGKVIEDFNWVCHAYCLMSNHYHLLIETPDNNLSKGMRQVNGVFTLVAISVVAICSRGGTKQFWLMRTLT